MHGESLDFFLHIDVLVLRDRRVGMRKVLQLHIGCMQNFWGFEVTPADIADENTRWQYLLASVETLAEANELIEPAKAARERGNPNPAKMLAAFANDHLWVFYDGKYREIEVLNGAH